MTTEMIEESARDIVGELRQAPLRRSSITMFMSRASRNLVWHILEHGSEKDLGSCKTGWEPQILASIRPIYKINQGNAGKHPAAQDQERNDFAIFREGSK